MTRLLLYVSLVWSVLFLTTHQPARSSEHGYPICSPVAHEVQEAWQRGQLSERSARALIERCLAWEDRNRD